MAEIAIRKDADVLPAFRSAKVGDVLVFAAGEYAPIRVTRLSWPEPGVTMRPAEGAKVKLVAGESGGRAWNALLFDACGGVTVEGFEVVTGELVGIYASGERICIKNCDVHGAIVGPDAIREKMAPAVAFDGRDHSLIDCELHHSGGACVGVNAVNLTIRGNRAHDCAGDFWYFGVNDGLHFEANVSTDMFTKQAAHKDGLQVVSTGTPGGVSRGVSIRRNAFFRGKGDPYQAIFFSDGKFEQPVVEDNVTASGNYWGIGIFNAVSPVVCRNYVTGDAGALDGSKVMVPWIKVQNSTDVVMEDNVMTSGPVYVNSTVKSDARNVTIPLPAAGDARAASERWLDLHGPAAASERVIGLQAGQEVRLSLPGETLIIRGVAA